ncbi:MAG TPA: FmdB family zinc ribbon protein [Mycobacteriales bacterium]|nr:FmdB family zinc ribbon protein [Mycobacteriales bacterium]
MPTYQYACTEISCGHRFEAVQSFSDPALSSCPVCSGSLRKVFSSVGVVFKGSGFYRTDSREKKSNAETTAKAANDTKKDSSPSSSSSSSSSDTKSSSNSSTSSSASSSTTAKAAAP